ncbi:MAG: LysM peptidoglycan-binding domain-containing protein [Epulopiscium sp.]|nr:LysM peptidoglycan-binding domain-containing protein [Candidatus Epulonipiscium sp.]
MQIVVIRPGDSLYQIARAYGVSVADIVQANQIPNPNQLVVGQSIVIPIVGSYHWVRPGESLYSISRQYGVPLSELIRINQIRNPSQIQVGLRLYIPPKTRLAKDVGAYIDPRITGANSTQVVDEVAQHLTYLPIFSYAVDAQGNLTPVDDQGPLQAAARHQVAPLLVLTNFAEGTFKTEIATTILNDEALQDKVLDEAIRIMDEKGYKGLDFDFEYLGAANREPYVRFIRKAAARMREKGYFISVALAPKLSAGQIGTLYEGHDYQALGEIVDFIFFMTYEWGWSGGPPMAVSPINQVRKVMDYAISVVPKDKIMMGMPLYGYDWTLPYVRGGKFARAISPQQAIEIAARYHARIEYDPIAQAPHFNYYDEQGRQHEVWFEDARSVQAKFDLVKELGIRGFFYWVLGYDFPQNWLLIEDNFRVNKRV